MRILLIHPTFFPIVGGAECLMRLHAEGISRYGHEVTVLTGSGETSLGTYQVQVLPELALNFPLYEQVRKTLEGGQTDMNYNRYVQTLQELIEPAVMAHDIIMTYGALTTHHNLALTQVLWQMAEKYRVLAWAVDLSLTNPDHTVPNPQNLPWSLMRRVHPKVTYIAPSTTRRDELIKILGAIHEQVKVIPTPFSPYLLFGLAVELSDWLDEKKILERDLVLYYPTRLLQRKQLDLAIQFTEAIRAAGIKVALIATALPDPYSNSTAAYTAYLTSLIQKSSLHDEVFLASRDLPWDDATWQQMFGVADVLLFPSKYESYGSGVIEGIIRHLPIWRCEIPSLHELDGGVATLIHSPQEAVVAARTLMEQPKFALRKKFIRHFNLNTVCEEKILPLIESIAP